MLLLYNANIYQKNKHPANAMVFDKGCIIAVGTDEDILNGFSAAKKKINLEGKTIWPGLTDSHVHLQLLAANFAKINCETKSSGECLARIKEKTEKLPAESWVLGHGWNHNNWEEGYGNAKILDQVCGGRPAYLTSKSLHSAWVNSTALELAGIDAQAPEPAGGTIMRDASGEPTGILLEAGAMSLVESRIPKPSLQDNIRDIQALIPELWRMGLVGIHDFDGIDCWNALREIHQKQQLKFRVRKHIPYDHLQHFIDAGIHTNDGDDWMHIGGVKLFADGALGPQTAAMQQPYENTNHSGTLLLTEAEIIEIGRFAVVNGISLAIHAIGDRANHVVINGLENIINYQKAKHLPILNHRIEHVQIIDPIDIARIADLGLIASVQPVHAPSDMQMADRYLGKRAENAYTYKSILDSGALMIFGSDAPVEPVNPFLGIHAAVTRRRIDGAPGLDGWNPGQRIELESALNAFSSQPAFVSNRGDHLGKIEAGYRADFLVLVKDPFKEDPDLIPLIQPSATFIDGTCVYQAEALF